MHRPRLSARTLLAAFLAIAGGAVARPAVAAATATLEPLPATAVLSALPWRSGSSCSETGIASWRGRALDATVAFVPSTSWDDMAKHMRNAHFRGRLTQAPQPVVSLPLLPVPETRQFARCAKGEFDGRFRQLGAILAASPGGSAPVIRLGWEANRSTRRPWGPATAADIPGYVACFRSVASALKSTVPGAVIEWTNGRNSFVPFKVTDMYPGDDAVDLWGVHYYDNGSPKIRTQADWDAQYTETYEGGPKGLGTWLAEAGAHGKKLAVSEWGLWDQGDEDRADDPVYVENMYRFFKDNAAGVAYENYYNCSDLHQLDPATKFPAAAARYRELWRSGR